MLRNGEQLLLAVVIPRASCWSAAVAGRRAPRHRPSPTDPVDVLTPGVLALAVMSTAFTSLAIVTGFERRYGVLKRLGSSPLPRAGLLLGKVGALLLVEAAPGRGHRRGGAGARLGSRATGWLGAGAGRRRSAPPRSPSLGLFLAGVLRAEATLAAANLVYLLLLAGGAVVLPTASYGALGEVVRWLPSGALGDAMRPPCIDGLVDWTGLAVLLVWAVARHRS